MEKALRAKAMAEQKIAEMNLDVAQTFSHRGPWTYPQMLKEGLRPLLHPSMFMSLLRRPLTVNLTGMAYWYSFPGVDPKADAETIKKSYKRLTLYLHPDNNDTAGRAEGAFKIVSEASNILSNFLTIIAYDQRRNGIFSYEYVMRSLPTDPHYQPDLDYDENRNSFP